MFTTIRTTSFDNYMYVGLLLIRAYSEKNAVSEVNFICKIKF